MLCSYFAAVSYESVYKSYLPGPDSHLTSETALLFPPSSPSSSSSLAHTSAGSSKSMAGPSRSRSPPLATSSSSSSASVSRNGSDTASSRTTVAHSEKVSPTTTNDEASTSGKRVQKHSSSSSSRLSKNSQPASGNGDKEPTSDVSASFTSGGGESSDTSSVPGSSESVLSSLTEITSENPFPEALQPPPTSSQPLPMSQVVSVADQNGLPPAPVSLFHDPIIYYGSSTNAALVSSENTGPLYDGSDSDDFTLDFFPALRQSASSVSGSSGDIGKPNSSTSLLSPLNGNEAVSNADVDLASVPDIVDSNQNSTTTSSESQTDKKSEEEKTAHETNGKVPDALTPQTLKDEELLHVEHNRYRCSKSSARPENWPDVQEQSSTLKDTLSLNGAMVTDSDNHQGHGESPPLSSLGSSSGFVIDGGEENVAKEGSGGKSNDIAAKTEVSTGDTKSNATETTSAQSTTEQQQQQTESEWSQQPSSSSSSGENKPTTTPRGNGHSVGSAPQTPSESGTPPALSRRDNLDVNAKEFTPRSTVLRSDSRPSPTYPSGLNPNAAAVYPYITNGGLPLLTTVPPPMVPLSTVVSGGPLSSATRRKMKGPAQPMADPSSTTTQPNSTIPYVSPDVYTHTSICKGGAPFYRVRTSQDSSVS